MSRRVVYEVHDPSWGPIYYATKREARQATDPGDEINRLVLRKDVSRKELAVLCLNLNAGAVEGPFEP